MEKKIPDDTPEEPTRWKRKPESTIPDRENTTDVTPEGHIHMKKKTVVTPEEHIHTKKKTEDIIPEEKKPRLITVK